MSIPSGYSGYPTIRARDRVRIEGSTTEYTVQAVGAAGQDVYLTDGDNTSIGTWVDIQQVTLIGKADQ